MKLYSDGTIEGSPQEVLEYLKLKYPAVALKCEDEPKQARGIQSPLMPNPYHMPVTRDSTTTGIYVSRQPSKAKFDCDTELLVTNKDVQKQALKYISTKDLTEELVGRTSVHKYNVSPEGKVTINEGELGCIIEGPAIVLEIRQ